MATRVRSYSKINLGLAIGPPRPDGFHGLTTLYQTLALYDFVTVQARRAAVNSITLRCNDVRVPLDGRNTVWKMIERALAAAGMTAAVTATIEKRLPIQGGMGAGSANAAAALVGLEWELGLELPEPRWLEVAAEVGSDVPLFLVGGSVLGTDRGQAVAPVADVTLGGSAGIACVIALPGSGVSTPAAFREWDRRLAEQRLAGLHGAPIRDTMNELSCNYASVFSSAASPPETIAAGSNASGIFPDQGSSESFAKSRPENLQGLPREQLHGRSDRQPAGIGNRSGTENDLAENSLLALVRTGIENDFETVVFAQYPSLREIKRHLTGVSGSPGEAVYAALSGSGSALFGLYRSAEDAVAAQRRLQEHGVQALVTTTMPRPLYWSRMFAE